jgi:NADH-quinone oxidoreductase subunit A
MTTDESPMPSRAADMPTFASAGELPPDFQTLLSLALYGVFAVGLVGLLMFLAWWLGDRVRGEAKDQPYESGVNPTTEASLATPVPFYLVAIFFIVFDVEMIFIVSWAVAYDLLGWAGFFQVTFFIFILFVGLVHLWKTGGLDWGPGAARHRGGRSE